MYWMDTWSSRDTAWFKRLTYSGVVFTDMFPHVSRVNTWWRAYLLLNKPNVPPANSAAVPTIARAAPAVRGLVGYAS
jgi:hypothetical protein